MSEEIVPDQETYDAAIAAGDSERVARAKAKSAAVKKARKAAGIPSPAQAAAAAASAAPGTSEQAAPAAAAAAAAPAAAAAAPAPAAAAASTAGAPAATATLDRPLSPAERQARVQAAMAGRGGTAVATGGGGDSSMTHRLLAMVPPEGIQRVEKTQDDKVNVWPHLLVEELVAVLACTAFLTVFSIFINAPLLNLANVNLTPNPSKAPWYFLGLQELLRYFHPMIAGVTIPGVGLLLLMAFPYLDKNPSMRPANRKFSIMLFTFFLMFSAILSTIGSLFRGPGYNWVFPWTGGLYFEF